MNWEYMPKIAALREAKKLTQLELAKKVGVTETTIANWEKGRSGIEWLDRIIRLCKALDCTPEELLHYIPPSEVEAKFHEIAHQFEEEHQPHNQPFDDGAQTDISVDVGSLKTEGGKFSDIVRLIELGQQAQARQLPLVVPPAMTRNSAKRPASK